jgi:hypothetical protein
VLKRGVTSGAMRRMERLLGELAADVTSRPQGRQDAEQGPTYEEVLTARVAELPEGGPRSAPGDYYGALLALFDEVAVTDPQPVNTLAAVMGVPRGTLNTRLATARRLRNREAARQRQADTGGDYSPLGRTRALAVGTADTGSGVNSRSDAVPWVSPAQRRQVEARTTAPERTLACPARRGGEAAPGRQTQRLLRRGG